MDNSDVGILFAHVISVFFARTTYGGLLSFGADQNNNPHVRYITFLSHDGDTNKTTYRSGEY